MYADDPMNGKKIEDLVSKITGKTDIIELNAVQELRGLVDDFPILMNSLYKRSRNAIIRSACLYYSSPYCRKYPSAVNLAIEALGDKSKMVRYHAALLLGLSLDERALPFLYAAAKDTTQESREDFLAAITAIEEKNQHLFMDRNRTGKVKMNYDLI